ncbi:MAG TPA: class II glutamine amidotransferase [Thermotogota bacterium]|nr:class II glutamine amidotransferase [Thermotogota bacterium]HRW35522.1 class II glutamine amidotransferase [Thermotogota bacterium]
MCRMMGIISQHLEHVEDWIEPLVHQSRFGLKSPHQDGYGIAFFEKGQLHTRREVSAIWQRKTDFSEDYGKILILHTRKASKGTLNLNNVHPFTATLDDESFAFCHNGTIFDIEKLKPSKTAESEKSSDSRIYFEYFLDHFELSGDFVEAVRSTVSDIKAGCSSITSLNSLFTDGKQLIAVRYCLTEEGYYTLGFCPLRGTTDGYVITTQPYEDHIQWQWLANKTITCFGPDGFQTFNIEDR